MNFRDELARIIASDPRYSIEAYAFVLEALNHAKHQKLKAKGRDRDKERSSEPDHEGRESSSSSSSKKSRVSGHVTGRAVVRGCPKTSLAPVRIAGGNRAQSLGRPVNFRYR